MEGFADMLCEQGLNILLDECSYKSIPHTFVLVLFMLILNTKKNKSNKNKVKQTNEIISKPEKEFPFIMPSLGKILTLCQCLTSASHMAFHFLMAALKYFKNEF